MPSDTCPLCCIQSNSGQYLCLKLCFGFDSRIIKKKTLKTTMQFYGKTVIFVGPELL